MAVYVVTGGAGFIGSNIVRRLLAEENEVRVVDDLSTGHRSNLEEVTDRMAFYEGSILDAMLLDEAMDGAEYVLHQAALASVQRSVNDPVASNEANVNGTLGVLEAARRCGVKRVVYASSSSLYGDVPTLPKHEEMAPQPRSPYAVSKLTGEYYCRAFASVYGMETVSLRYFNVFGPHQDPASQYAAVIPIFVNCILEGRNPTVFGDGEQSRDFTYVEDVVTANLQAATAPGAAGEYMNLGCGGRHSLNELLDLLQSIIGRQVEPIYAEARAGDVKHSQADISKAARIIGYEPQVSFEEGLRRTVAYYRQLSG